MIRKLGLSVASLLVVLLSLELVIRALGLGVHDHQFARRKYAQFQIINHEGDYFYYPPNSEASFWDSVWKFNSFGLRDVEPQTKSPGTFRILVLGDSVTAGEGVEQNLIFPSLLRERLRRARLDVLAAGVSGWNTLEEERFLRTNIDRLNPDVVVLLYVMNDNEPVNSIRRTLEGSLTLKDEIFDALVVRSRLFEWMNFLARKVVGPNAYALSMLAQWNRQVKAAGPPFAPNDLGWIASRDAMLRIRDLLSSRNAELVVFLYNLGAFEAEREALARLREFGQESGVRVFDTLPFLATRKWQSIVNNPFVDPHPNVEGHALLAAGIARTLVKEGIVPSPPGAAAESPHAAPDR